MSKDSKILKRAFRKAKSVGAPLATKGLKQYAICVATGPERPLAITAHAWLLCKYPNGYDATKWAG